MKDRGESKPPAAADGIALKPDRWVLALLAMFLLHVVIFAAGGVAAAVEQAVTTAAAAQGQSAPWLPIPDNVVLLLTVTFLMAQCSALAIGLARSRLSSYSKAVVTGAVAASIWVLLTLLLPAADFQESVSASWLAALVTQAVLTALGAFWLRALYDGDYRFSHRFNILFLLLWTTAIAILLGFARWLIQALGWDVNAFAWEYFAQLQVVGLFSAVLAVLMLAVITMRYSWAQRGLLAVSISILTTIVATAVLVVSFETPGAEVVDIAWVFGCQSLLLAAVLIPLYAVLQQTGDNATSSLQIPPPPDSGR